MPSLIWQRSEGRMHALLLVLVVGIGCVVWLYVSYLWLAVETRLISFVEHDSGPTPFSYIVGIGQAAIASLSSISAGWWALMPRSSETRARRGRIAISLASAWLILLVLYIAAFALFS